MAADDYGGYGTEASNSVWFDYRATKTDADGKKVPYGKLTRYDKEAGTRAEYSYISGKLAGVCTRENKGNAEHNIDPYAELLISLSYIENGAEKFLRLPLRASSVAAYSLSRRLANIPSGAFVKVAAKVIDGEPTIWVQRIEGGEAHKVEPIDGISFVDASKLTGAKATAARAQNAEAREEFVAGVVQAHDAKHAADGQPRSFVTAAGPVAIPDGGVDEYDPFADE